MREVEYMQCRDIEKAFGEAGSRFVCFGGITGKVECWEDCVLGDLCIEYVKEKAKREGGKDGK